LRVVVDTNVLVASLINRGGRPAQRVGIAIHGRMLLLSQSLLQELIAVLERPYFAARVDGRDRAAFPLELARVAHLVEPTETIRACRDPKDDRFSKLRWLECGLHHHRRRGSPRIAPLSRHTDCDSGRLCREPVIDPPRTRDAAHGSRRPKEIVGLRRTA
jgi:putative PIN family toxin of toxin-antitoxin system